MKKMTTEATLKTNGGGWAWGYRCKTCGYKNRSWWKMVGHGHFKRNNYVYNWYKF